MTAVVGIDPGATGGIALLDDDAQLLDIADMPYIDGLVAAPLLADLMRDHLLRCPGAVAWVEQAQAMPRQGVSSTFRYGAGYGVILGVLGALDIPTFHIRPAMWKRTAGLNGDKAASRRRAIERWPHMASAFARVKDDGRAEAALIALHGHTMTRGQTCP